MITTNKDLINHLKNLGVLESKSIEAALANVDRRDFVREEDYSLAYYDDALPIGQNQTISQPLTVVFMLELLDVKEGNNVMDIGSGSGWQSCLLGHIVGSGGTVHAIEVIPEIYDFGKRNASKYPFLKDRIFFYCKNAKDGLPEESKNLKKFDRIICAAEVLEVPNSWREQLKEGGIMVYPKDNSIIKEIKKEDNYFIKEIYPGFVFVPFV